MSQRTGRRLLAAVIAAVAALVAAAAPAGASSLVYAKDGNVWVTDPSGAKQYQVTYDGGYSSPSQADDGTIVALQNRRFVRMDRSGRRLNAPVDGIGTDPGFFENFWTWKLESGHANYDAQWAFSIQDATGTYYDFGDAEVSPDGSRFAATAGGDATSDDQLFIGTTNGPLWVGEPPYDNGLTALPAQPDLRCGGSVGRVVSPSWSPDSRELAYSLADGVHVLGADNLADCRALTDRTIAPGGSEPDWGPADVDPSNAPSPPKGGGPATTAGGGSTALALTRVKLTPRAFRAARGGKGVIAARATGSTLRFKLSEPARLTLSVRRGRHRIRGTLHTAGRPGLNSVRLTGRIARRSLRPGRYTLRIAARDLSKRERATASVKFRITR